MSTLFELTNEFNQLYELATSDEVDEQAFNDTLEGMMFELEQKSEGYVHVLERLDMEAQKATEIADMMKHKADIRKNSPKKTITETTLTLNLLTGSFPVISPV